MQIFQISLNEQQINVVGAALVKAPYEVAAPVIADINRQLEAIQQSSKEQPGTEVDAS